MAISAAYSIWLSEAPLSCAAAAAAIEQAEPISAWQPASAPDTVALARMEEPNKPAVASASRIFRRGMRRTALKK